jgi:hypothetical protein
VFEEEEEDGVAVDDEGLGETEESLTEVTFVYTRTPGTFGFATFFSDGWMMLCSATTLKLEPRIQNFQFSNIE